MPSQQHHQRQRQTPWENFMWYMSILPYLGYEVPTGNELCSCFIAWTSYYARYSNITIFSTPESLVTIFLSVYLPSLSREGTLSQRAQPLANFFNPPPQQIDFNATWKRLVEDVSLRFRTYGFSDSDNELIVTTARYCGKVARNSSVLHSSFFPRCPECVQLLALCVLCVSVYINLKELGWGSVKVFFKPLFILRFFLQDGKSVSCEGININLTSYKGFTIAIVYGVPQPRQVNSIAPLCHGNITDCED